MVGDRDGEVGLVGWIGLDFCVVFGVCGWSVRLERLAEYSAVAFGLYVGTLSTAHL